MQTKKLFQMWLPAILLVIATVMIPSMKASAATVNVDGWVYNYNNGIAELAGYTGSEKSVTLPVNTTINGTNVRISKIAAGAFAGNTVLEEVVIPEGYSSIGARAFSGAVNLKSVTINCDLADCSGYSADTYSSRCAENAVFYKAGYNSDTFTVTFGGSCTRIPMYLFATAFDKGNDVYCRVTDVKIGDSVKEIGKYAFYRCYNLKSLTMGSGVETIGQGAFENATSLETLTLGAGVKTIGTYAFKSSGLKTVNFNTALTTIGNGAFSFCASLTSVNLNKSLATISAYAFESTTSLENIVIPEGVTSLGGGAFKNCTSLKSVTINGTLADCSGYSVDTYSSRCAENAVFYNAGDNVTGFSVTFGNGVTRVPAYLFATAFDEGKAVYARVSSITIPETVTEIGGCAIYRCYALKEVTVYSPSATYGNNVYSNCKEDMNVRCYYASTTETAAKTANAKVTYLQPKTPVLSTIANTDTGVQLTWQAAIGAKEYDVVRSEGSSTSVTVVATVEETTYTDTKVASGKSYKYYIVAKAPGATDSERSEVLKVKFLKTPTIKSIENTKNGATITWTKVSGAKGYKIYGLKGSSKKWTLLKTITSPSTVKWTDTNAKKLIGTAYKYKVVAYTSDTDLDAKESLESARNNMYQSAMGKVTLKNTANGKLSITFAKASKAKVTGYEIQYSTDKNFKKSVKTVTTTKNNVGITKLKKGTTYYVRVRSYKKYTQANSYSAWSSVSKLKLTK